MNKKAVILCLALFTNASYALTPEERGLEITQEVDKRDTGFGDSKTELKMILKNRHGEESIRALEIKTLEVNGDGDKSLTLFNSPADVKGTAFLSFTHALTPDDQWLYLPAVKRVKRISSSNKSGPFLGSEFAFEDLTSFEIAKYSFKYFKDEPVDGIDCFVVEMTPKYEDSGYTREISWIDKERYIVLKVDYFDRKDALLKTLTFKDYQQYLDKFWRANEMLMVNHQNGKSTVLTYQNYQFKAGLTDRDFDQATLQRAR
ncbi:MAG: outer membrane lipoprotein-sorting protein [Methylococcaceae bacterium]